MLSLYFHSDIALLAACTWLLLSSLEAILKYTPSGPATIFPDMYKGTKILQSALTPLPHSPITASSLAIPRHRTQPQSIYETAKLSSDSTSDENCYVQQNLPFLPFSNEQEVRCESVTRRFAFCSGDWVQDIDKRGSGMLLGERWPRPMNRRWGHDAVQEDKIDGDISSEVRLDGGIWNAKFRFLICFTLLFFNRRWHIGTSSLPKI